MLGTFIDTLIICSITGLVIVVSGAWTGGENGASLTAAAFESSLPGMGGYIVTFGIQPTAPETGYGYIESSGHDVLRFVEKPTLDKAQEYYNSDNFLWNSGIFCFSAGTMLKEMVNA